MLETCTIHRQIAHLPAFGVEYIRWMEIAVKTSTAKPEAEGRLDMAAKFWEAKVGGWAQLVAESWSSWQGLEWIEFQRSNLKLVRLDRPAIDRYFVRKVSSSQLSLFSSVAQISHESMWDLALHRLVALTWIPHMEEEEEEELQVLGSSVNEVSFRARPYHNMHRTLGVDTGATGPF
jgi:hypothetical protein